MALAYPVLVFEVEGSELKKVRPNSRVYQRYYLMDAGLQALFWEPSKKESDKARIALASIREVSVRKKKDLLQFDLWDSFCSWRRSSQTGIPNLIKT